MSSVTDVQWLRSWLKERLELKPNNSVSLTYFVASFFLYRSYLQATYAAGRCYLRRAEFDEILFDTFPELRWSSLRGQAIIDGARFYRDRIGGELFYGV